MKRFLLSIVCILTIALTANAETYKHTFKKGDLKEAGGEVTLSNIVWNSTEANILGWTNGRGISIGKNGNVCPSYTLSCNAFAEFTIRSVKVTTQRPATGDAKITISAGNSETTFELGTTATVYELECYEKGEIKINWTATSNVYYANVIEVTYELPADMVEVKTPTFKTSAGIYADKVQIIAETTDLDAVLYYTLDGTEPSYEDFNSETPAGTTKCSKGWQMITTLTDSITINTIKILSVKEDGEAVYKSEIAEATYIVSPTTPYINISSIESGSVYTMVAADSAACCNYGNVAGAHLPTKTATTANENYIESVACAGFTFTATNGGYTIQDVLGHYICPGDKEGEFSFTTAEPAVWNIQLESDNATISCNSRTILYSVQDSIFGCYSEKSENHLLPKLYKQRSYPEYTITPENNSFLDELESILITCEEGITESNLVVTCNEIEDATFTVTQKDSKTLEIKADKPITTVNNTNISINITGDIILNPDGMNMTLPVPEKYGMRTLVRYTINGNAPAATITEVSPADGDTVEELSHFIFTFSYYASHSDDASLMPVLAVEGVEWTHALEKTLSKGDGSNINMDQAALKTTEPVRGNGVYLLEIPTGYFTDGNGKEIEGITLRYIVKNDSGIIAGIESIGADGSNAWSVFSVAGVKVLETTDIEELNTLPKGVYIINSKKTLVK